MHWNTESYCRLYCWLLQRWVWVFTNQQSCQAQPWVRKKKFCYWGAIGTDKCIEGRYFGVVWVGHFLLNVSTSPFIGTLFVSSKYLNSNNPVVRLLVFFLSWSFLLLFLYKKGCCWIAKKESLLLDLGFRLYLSLAFSCLFLYDLCIVARFCVILVIWGHI